MNHQLRRILTEEALKYEQLQAAVFTTFGFNQDFFENNVLPALFDIEETREAVRRNAVNHALLDTAVTVFFDASSRPRDGGTYRYQVSSVTNPQGVFHPKIIVLAGKWKTDAPADEEQRLTLIVSSANLSYAGWGKNQEAVSRMYIQAGNQQAAQELEQALTWLRETNPTLSDEDEALVAVTRCRRILNDLKEYHLRRQYRETDAEFYFSPFHPKGFIPELMRRRRKKWSRLVVFSPYWGTVASSVAKTNARVVELVPAFIHQSTRFGLGRDAVTEYNNERAVHKPRLVLKRLKHPGGDRFWHAKFYFLIDKQEGIFRVAVGSVNFTDMALRGAGGNTEAMLIFESTKREMRKFKPPVVTLELDDDGMHDESEDFDLTAVPFEAHVAFDWKTKQYTVYLMHHQRSGVSNCVLHLPSGISITADDNIDNRTINAKDSLPSNTSFHISYLHKGERQNYYGLITETNLDLSERTYTRALSIIEILESWKSPVDDGGLGVGGRESLLEGETEGVAEESFKPNQKKLDLLNFYDFYRSFYERRKKLEELKDDPQAVRNYLHVRSDSVFRLARQVAGDTDSNPVYAYLLLLECDQIFKQHKKDLVDTVFSKEVNRWMREAKVKVKASVPDAFGTASGDEVMAWFERQLKGAWT